MAPAPVTPEEEPRCTICGEPLRRVGREPELMHYRYGRLDRMLREPFPHVATLDPQQPPSP